MMMMDLIGWLEILFGSLFIFVAWYVILCSPRRGSMSDPGPCQCWEIHPRDVLHSGHCCMGEDHCHCAQPEGHDGPCDPAVRGES